ncbi:MAG: TonB-dependent receptor, partial [Acidobacteria bacterium]|nr:TonB-dependent receptor [Acidobacteriota bacterium]
TNIAQNAVSNESGNYTFPNVRDGVYRVESELSGFKKAVRENVQVDVNSTIRVDFKLEVGELSETLTVTSEAPALQTDRTDTGRIIQGQQIQAMPLGFGRNFQGMWATVPGATRPSRPHSEFFNPQDSLESKINGQSRLSNNVQIEGVDNNHKTGLLTVLIPSAEALESVAVTTSNFDAEFGRAGGAVTNVTLKSGTNNLRGSAFWFHGNDALNAKGYFAQSKPDTTYNQFGFTLGGPIRRDRLFYFGDYQRTNDNLGKVFRFFVPPAEWRNGDFSSVGNTTIYDPLTGDGTGNDRSAFANNQVPVSRLSPIALAILQRVPLPNLAGQPIGQPNYEATTVRERRTDSFDVKVNWQASNRDQISPRFSYSRPTVFDPSPYGDVGGPANGGFAGTGIQDTISSATSWTRTWTNTLIMEVRAGVTWYHNEAIAQGVGLTTAQDLGIPGVNLNEYTSGISSMSIQGYSNPVVGFSNSMPWDRGETTTNISTVITKLVGDHSVKVGGDWRRNRDFLLQTQSFGGPRGTFNFNGSGTSRPADPTSIRNNPANSLASFLLDYPNDIRRDVPIIDEPGTRHNQYFAFVHDKWQVSPRVTVDLGLRYEYYTPLVGIVTQGGLSNYDLSNNTLQVSGFGDIPDNLGVRTSKTNFAPRTGVSWRVTDRDVIRLGYGATTTPFPDNSYAFNYPTRGNVIQQAANAFQSAGRLSTGFTTLGEVAIPASGVVPVDQPFLRNSGLFNVPQDLGEGVLHSWNLAYQRELPWGFTGEAAYVGNRGVDIIYSINRNAATVLGLDQRGRPLFDAFGRTADVPSWTSGRSDYHSLQAKIDRRFRNGVLITNSYTLGRGRNFADDNGGIATPADMERSYGLTGFDRRHTWVSSFVAGLPFFRESENAILRHALGGWQVSGLLSLMSGTPLSVTADGALLRAPGNTLYADRVGTPEVLGNFGPGQQYFSTSAFAQPAPATFGNTTRNGSGLRGPGFTALDFSLVKRAAFGSDYRFLEFRADAFNLTNTPAWGNPNTNVASPTFGQISSAGNQRIIRFALKYAF